MVEDVDTIDDNPSHEQSSCDPKTPKARPVPKAMQGDSDAPGCTQVRKASHDETNSNVPVRNPIVTGTVEQPSHSDPETEQFPGAHKLGKALLNRKKLDTHGFARCLIILQ
ncbi:MAG: hypothetical protein AABZ40_01250, partial [Thermodesulfobacteriota bacterium]